MGRLAFPGPGENGKAIAIPGRSLYACSIMHALALEIDEILRQLDPLTATRFERLVREAAALASPVEPTKASSPRMEWLAHLARLRASLGMGKSAPSAEAILDDIRDGR